MSKGETASGKEFLKAAAIVGLLGGLAIWAA